MLSKLFPDFDDPVTTSAWDLSYSLPVPKFQPRCPVCGDEHPLARYFLVRLQGQATSPWRCDTSFKCTNCAVVWIHGVAITKEYFENAIRIGSERFGGNNTKSHKFPWRDAKQVLSEEVEEI